jgi:hypothetical protein
MVQEKGLKGVKGFGWVHLLKGLEARGRGNEEELIVDSEQ